MRPYLAIIKDSFREAIASRVLWVLLALITVKLIALAATGIRVDVRTDFGRGDVMEGPRLAGKLRQAAAASEPSPGKRMWGFIGEGNQQKLIALTQVQRGERGEYFQGMEVLLSSLTTLIHRRDLYDEQAWNSVTLSKEAKELLARPRESLSERELARLNRVLIESAFPAHFRHRTSQAIVVTMLGLDTLPPLPFTKEQANGFIKEWVLSLMINYVVGLIGLVAGILVTSSIVPQMFEPGSITLLLSKPVSRSLLFISKFVSGCAFVLISMAYLIVGLWLIAGLRFGIWNHGMLWCIPIFMFIFLIYYSVSALAGLIWKSPVLSVVVTVMFYVSCQTVGTIKEAIENLALNERRVVKLVDADGALIAVRENGVVESWDAGKRDWQRVDEPGGGQGVPTIDGPYYHAQTRQILVGQGFQNPFGLVGQRITLRIGSVQHGWNLSDGPALPGGTSTFLVEHDGRLLAVAEDDVFRLRGDPAPAQEQIKVFGVPLPFTGATFRPALADSSLNFTDPLTAAADPLDRRLVVCSSNDVYLFSRQDDGQFAVRAKRKLKGEEQEGSAVAVAGRFVIVAREDGPVWFLSSDDLSIVKEQTLEPFTQPRFAAASPNGKRIGVLFQNRRLWLIDTESGAAQLAAVGGQGDISGFTFSADRLLVATHVNRVTAYDSQSLASKERYWPAQTRFDIVYYYSILPFYTVFPKPGELDNTVHYILTGKRTTDGGIFRGQVAQRREDLHPWRPVRHGLIFVAVVMLVACIYIERHEF